MGFDAYKEEYVNMVDAGILDPAKVTRSALQNATSVASTFLTTESVVAAIKEAGSGSSRRCRRRNGNDVIPVGNKTDRDEDRRPFWGGGLFELF